jgi:acyl carrier protein
MEVQDRIRRVISAVFDISIESITDDTSPDTVGSWDSLKHMYLIIALEEEFSFQISDNEIIEMINYSLIKNIIIEKLD